MRIILLIASVFLIIVSLIQGNLNNFGAKKSSKKESGAEKEMSKLTAVLIGIIFAVCYFYR